MEFFKNEYQLICNVLERIEEEVVINFKIYPIEELDEDYNYKKSIIYDPIYDIYYAILENDADIKLEKAIEDHSGMMEWHWDDRRLSFFNRAYTQQWKEEVQELIDLSEKRKHERKSKDL